MKPPDSTGRFCGVLVTQAENEVGLHMVDDVRNYLGGIGQFLAGQRADVAAIVRCTIDQT